MQSRPVGLVLLAPVRDPFQPSWPPLAPARHLLWPVRNLLHPAHLPLAMAGLLLAGCGEAPEPQAAASGDAVEERVVDATEELRIGLVDGDPRYLFGTIQGIAVDEESRVWVADGLEGRIKVYDEDGEHLFEFGGVGDGPGEFYNPCCLAFDAQGRLWVWNHGDLARQIRYDAFDVSSIPPRHVRRVQRAAIGGLWPLRRVLFDGEGNLLHPTFSTERTPTPQGVERRTLRFDSEGNLLPSTFSTERTGTPQGVERRTLRHRLHLDEEGNELRRVAIPVVSRDSLGGLPAPPTPGVVTRSRHGPLIRTQLRAHSPRGGFVEGVNTRYEVNWYDEDGEFVRVLRRDVAGPPLAPEERSEAAETLRRTQQALRDRGDPPLDLSVPERHNPLERLFFDGEGRLWVQRRTAATDGFEMADLYGPDGEYLQTVRWPRGVLLYHGAVDGDVIWGVTLDELDVARLVKLRM